MIADCKLKLLNYVEAYDAICQCGKIIYESENNPEDFPRELLRKYHECRGKLALLNENPVESAENYDKATRFADDDSKFAAASAALSALNFLDMPSEDVALPHLEYQKLVENIQPFTEYHERGEKIKIGYISSGFCQHELFVLIFGMISCHDKNKYEVTCYSLNKKDDAYTNVFRSQMPNFVDVKNLSYFEFAKKIHDDKIDILIDLMGHSEGNMLPALAYKPAPIQISGLGYSATTGMKAIDYFITDEIIDPPGEHDKFFKSGQSGNPEFAPCTQQDHVTFGTICDYTKINDDMLQIWKEILNRVPDSVLIIRAKEFESISTRDHAYSRMKAMGFNMDKVVLLQVVPEYLNEMLKLDLILDSYPCVGESQTIDAVYMGVPTITLCGERRSTRFSYSILKALELENLVVNNVQDYIERAVGLASDKEALDALHKSLRNMLINCEKLNPQNITRALENHFEKILAEKKVV